MVTRLKSGVIKPRAYSSVCQPILENSTDAEPKSVKEALGKPHWHKAMIEEYFFFEQRKFFRRPEAGKETKEKTPYKQKTRQHPKTESRTSTQKGLRSPAHKQTTETAHNTSARTPQTKPDDQISLLRKRQNTQQHWTTSAYQQQNTDHKERKLNKHTRSHKPNRTSNSE